MPSYVTLRHSIYAFSCPNIDAHSNLRYNKLSHCIYLGMSAFLYLRKQGTIILTLTFHFSYRSVILLSLRELHKKCNAQKKNNFLKKWKLIQELPSTNPNSFWSIASYHGMPFKERRVPPGEDKSEEDVSGTDKDKDPETWGGYCQHGNVLFLFWHRLHCLRLEQAL